MVRPRGKPEKGEKDKHPKKDAKGKKDKHPKKDAKGEKDKHPKKMTKPAASSSASTSKESASTSKESASTSKASASKESASKKDPQVSGSSKGKDPPSKSGSTNPTAKKGGFLEAEAASDSSTLEKSDSDKKKIKYDRFLLFIPTRDERHPRYNPIMEVGMTLISVMETFKF